MTDEIKQTRGLSSDALKLIAIIAMTIDHAGWLIFPGYSREIPAIIMHIIGRITCPVMCYFVAEGYHYTRNLRKYAGRLAILAIVSHFAYIFASWDFAGWRSFIPFAGGSVLNQTSVAWPLLGGLAMLYICDSKLKTPAKVGGVLLICLLTFPSDWSCIASLCILSIGSNRGNPKKQLGWCAFYMAIYAAVYFFALDRVYGLIQLCVVLSVPIIALYNGERGRLAGLSRFLKKFFYVYYPAHLVVIGIIRTFMCE